jgi:3-hydroxymyristoyl/3-hydroxydecanoyl-(acyl carrier protein) dehydratase
VSAVDFGASHAAAFQVPHTHPCLPGHFPGRALVPGVVILDHVLDAIERVHGPFAAGMGLPLVKFMQPLLPGQTATVGIEPLGAGRWRFQVHRGHDLLASGEVRA